VRRVVIMGAGGRDFHDFNVVFRDDPGTEVVAFTAAQIPGIDDRVYPASLAGPRYPDGIPIRPESELAELLGREAVDEVVFAYSDLSHEEVMHRASAALAAGADFRLIGPTASCLRSTKPVIAVCATRTGAGKSQTSRYVAHLVRDADLTPVLVRHPMPYGALESMRIQRFATRADIDAAGPTIEEREEYEQPVLEGIVMYAGVDYGDILAEAEAEADVVIWDGGNNDQPFFAPDVLITVADALRPGHETRFHPGEANVRAADIIVLNKAAAVPGDELALQMEALRRLNPDAAIVTAASPVELGAGSTVSGARVLVVEDGPTITHGGLAEGAGAVAARTAGARELVDPRPWAVGSIATTFERCPAIGSVLPAMGYSPEQVEELLTTIRSVPCDVVVTGTPIDLARLGDLGHPVRHVSYRYADLGRPTLAEALGPHLTTWREGARVRRP